MRRKRRPAGRSSERRLLAGLSQEVLAERGGKDVAEIDRWERDIVQPSLEELDDLVRACGFHLQFVPLWDSDRGSRLEVILGFELRALRRQVADLELADDEFPFLRFELGGELDTLYRFPWRWLSWPLGLLDRFRAVRFVRIDRMDEDGYFFDLPGRLSRRRRRIAQAVDRASALFESCFDPGHDGFLDAYFWDLPGDSAYALDQEQRLLALLPERLRPRVERHAIVERAEEPDEEDRVITRLTVALAPRDLDYETLFRLVARTDMGLEPFLNSYVYILDETDPLIFLMYDDRGAIVHAPTADRLRPLYERFGDWLVDPWRPKMDAIFAQG